MPPVHQVAPACSRCGREPPQPELLDSNWVIATDPWVVHCPSCHAQTTQGTPGDFGWSWQRIESLSDARLDVLAEGNAERAAQLDAWAQWLERRARSRRDG